MASTDLQHLIQDKYEGNESLVTADDLERLASGEPVAYVIGWMPFLGTRIDLSSKPLIPRPETEYWVHELIPTIRAMGTEPIRVLDLCAGSGCVGIALLHALPNVHVTFVELKGIHEETIQKSLAQAGIQPERFAIFIGDLFDALPTGAVFDVIATNPPYIPSERALPESVVDYEPAVALYAGTDGLFVVRRIAEEMRDWLAPSGQVWLECDVSHVQTVLDLCSPVGVPPATVRMDQYGRPRVVVAWA